MVQIFVHFECSIRIRS